MFNTIRFKLSMIAAIPLLFALVLAAHWVVTAHNTHTRMSDLDSLVQLAGHASAYMHETQKERGATAVFVGERGKLFGETMNAQRKATDAARATLREYLTTYDPSVHGEVFSRELAIVATELELLDEHRVNVNRLIPVEEAIAFYTNHNADVLRVVAAISRLNDDDEFTSSAAAYEKFLQGKERAGLERALMSATFAADRFEPGVLREFGTFVNAQDAYFDSFLEHATPEQAAFYNQTLSGSVVDEVQRMRDIAFEKGEESSRTRLYLQLLDECGYGGAIHNFKNYLLRYEARYVERFRDNYKLACSILDKWETQADTDEEREACVTLRLTLKKYNDRIVEIVRARDAGKSIMEIDNLVKIDDAPALAALAKLSKVSRNEGFGVDPSDWFEMATRKIKLMRDVEGRLTADLRDGVSAMRDSARSSFIILSLIASIVTALVVGVVFVIGNRIVRPVVQLSEAATLVARGDLTQRIETKASGEIGELARCFDVMVSSLSESVTRLEQQSDDLRLAKRTAEVADRTKSEFLANMSHEIRTPMTAILGFAETVAENTVDPENAESIATIRRNGEHLLDIINDILDLSKVEAGRMAVERVAFNPCKIIAEVVSLMRLRAAAKGLAFNFEYMGAIPETIQSDPTRLRQILINLIANAIKFTENGKVSLIVRCVDGANSGEAGSPATPHMQFDVLDTGLGLSDEQAKMLFKPFTQADTSTTRKFGGTGLGLTISKRFAELLDGDISLVESEVGVGTRFRASVATGPLEGVKMLDDPMSATSVADTSGGAANASPPGLHGLRVLLAEDGPDNQRLISFVLKKAGADVTVMENGKLALDAALAARDEGAPFDVILMDMQMTVMDGYDATGKLREAGYTRPIIALTAHAMAIDRQKCLDAGCDDYTTKPIDRKKLIELVAQHASRQELRKADDAPRA